jgi:hypothetical protein
MVNKYNNFLLEKRVSQLILENNLMATNDFLARLKTIKGKSKIAELLHRAFSNQPYVSEDLPQNWIDVTDIDDTVSFISDKKADKIDNWDEESPYAMKGRTPIKIGRFAKAFFTNKEIIDDALDSLDVKFTPKEYEEFVNLYKSTDVKSTSTFELISGEDIKSGYDFENYKWPDRGQLGNSCMKYERCQEYFGIYTDNPESCQLLVLISENKVIGRALVWKLSKSPCGATHFMDRVYTASDSDMLKFNNYCDKEGWMRKYINSFDSLKSYYFIYKGATIFGEASVILNRVNFSSYPFVDTLSWLDKKKKTISNVASAGASCMTDSEGLIIECYECSGTGEVTNNGCTYCSGMGIIEGSDDKKCTYCEGKGEYTGPCPSCARSLEMNIKEISSLGFSNSLIKLAKDYWNNLRK